MGEDEDGEASSSSPSNFRERKHRYGNRAAQPQLAVGDMLHEENSKLVLVLVGLPARGKTYIGRKISNYLNWLGIVCRVFNVGMYRRNLFGAQQAASFFSSEDEQGSRARWHAAEQAMEDMIQYLEGGGQVAIYDATNSTRQRRNWIRERCREHFLEPLFIESICNDPALIEKNILNTKMHSPDYAGMSPEEAVEDFKKRIDFYEKSYETIVDPTVSYIKLIDVGTQTILNRISGFLAGKLVFFLMNLNIHPPVIWLTRHGESEYNSEGKIGGDPNLTPQGRRYARKMGEWIDQRKQELFGVEGEKIPPTSVWTSSLRRTVETAECAGFYDKTSEYCVSNWKVLDEIDAGDFEGLTYAYMEENMPEEWKARQDDKLRYRYPRGESYEDVVVRLEPVIIELERRDEKALLIVAHQAVLRAIYGYLTEKHIAEVPRLDMPLHTVIELYPRAYGVEEKRFLLEPLEHEFLSDGED